MDITAYLRRIDYHGPLDPTIATLRALHMAHLLTVPFENLDIHLGRPIVLDEAALFDKIVGRRRGGFCYELNGLFAALLRELGFDVTLISARVRCEDGSFGPEFDHLALVVREPGAAGQGSGAQQAPTLEPLPPARWLADVGFGDSFRTPLRLDDPGEQIQTDGQVYRVVHDGVEGLLLRRGTDADWEPQYRFTLQPRRYADFATMCQYHQTAPDSTFTRRRICSRATPDGRITLSDMRLIVSTGGARHERVLRDQAEYAAALRQHFGIELGGPVAIAG